MFRAISHYKYWRATRDAFDYLRKFGKCPGCRSDFVVTQERTAADMLVLHIHCSKCHWNETEYAKDADDTVSKIVKRISKSFYQHYQQMIVDRLRGDEEC